MAGRQIRWTSLGRIAAIAAAVLAAIVSVPALLGGERPPPVPADVGLVPPAPAAEPLGTAAEPEVPPPVVAGAKSGLEKGERRVGREEQGRGKRGSDKRDRERHRRGNRPPRRQRRDHQHREEGAESVAVAQAPAPAYVPAPVYSPPPPGEFHFER